MFAFTILTQHGTVSPNNCNKAIKRWKREHKLERNKQTAPFTDDMTVHVENPQSVLLPKFLELKNESIKVTGYKINTQKLITFLYTKNKYVETKIKITRPFTVVKNEILTYKTNNKC